MAESINRVHEALKAWEKMEAENVNSFPPSVMNSAEFAEKRLNRLNSIAAKLSFTSNEQERNSLMILSVHRQQLRAIAYPMKQRLLMRIVTKFLSPVLFQARKQIAQLKQEVELKKIQDAMIKAGFREHVGKVFDRIRQGERNFSLSTDVRVNQNDQVHFNLKFTFDHLKGHAFDSYQAHYRNSLKPGEHRQHNFSVGKDMVHRKRAEILIAGRAILDTSHSNGAGPGKWVKFDTLKDEQGNFLMKHLPGESFDVRKHCQELPFWKNLDPFKQLFIVGNLISGNRPAVNFDVQGKPLRVLFECDPENRLIQAVNEKGKPVDLKKLEPKPLKTSAKEDLSSRTAQNIAAVPPPKQKNEKDQKVSLAEDTKLSANNLRTHRRTNKISTGIALAKQIAIKNQPPAKAAKKNKKARTKISH